MMLVTAGAVDVTTYFHLRLAADGTDATGLTITNFDLQYVRAGAAPAAKVDATALAATDSAHADNKAIEVDATDQPGVYRVDWPDAAFAAGVDEVILTVKVATAFTESLRVRLMSATRGLAGTALPAAAADAAGGLVISDAGGLDIDDLKADINTIDDFLDTEVAAILADTNELQTDWVNGGRLDLLIDAIKAKTDNLPSDPADASVVSGEIAALDAKIDTIDNFLDTEIAAILAAVDTEVAAIITTLGTPAGASISADLVTIDNFVDDIEGRLTAALATKLAAHAAGVLVLVVDAGSSTTEVVFKTVEGGAASATNDFYNGRVIVFTSGALAGQATSISDYVGATKTATVVALTGAPAENVTGVIV